MSKRFITDLGNLCINGSKIIIIGDEVHHINVLRYNKGDKVYINEYEIEIENISKDKIEGIITGKMPQKGVPNVNITLVQSYLKSDKMDYVVQKSVELGVKEIIPVITKNTVVKLDDKDKIKKRERLSKIVKEAIEQCGRTDEVSVRSIQNLSKIDFSIFDLVIICHENSKQNLKDVVNEFKKKHIKNIAVIVGPEGGLDENEVESILRLNCALDISLGERILRAETATNCILSILLYEFELNS